MQLKYKITISMITGTLLVLLLVSFFYTQHSYKSVMDYEKKKLELVALDSAKDIKFELMAKLDNVKTLITAPIVLNTLKRSNTEFDKYDKETIKTHIDDLNKRWIKAYDDKDEFVKSFIHNRLGYFLKKQQSTFDGVYGEIFVTNKYGAIVATTGKLSTLAHAHKYWWKEAYAKGKGKIFFDDRGFDASVNGYVIGIVVPIKEDGKIIGIIKANINIIGTLSKLVTSYNKLGKGTVKIVRTKGTVVFEESLPPLSTSINPKILINLKNNEVGSRLINNYSKNILVAYSPIVMDSEYNNIGFGGKIKTTGSTKGNNREIWHSVVGYDRDLALKENFETNRTIIYIGLFLTLLSGIVAFYVGHWISKPIEELQKVQNELIKQEEMMIAQSRHAAMGEMISMIAHQWRQPLSVISMGANNIMADIELDTVDNETLKDGAAEIIDQTQELSKTIDDFKEFFKPVKNTEIILAKDIFEDAFSVIGKSLENNDIEVIKNYHSTKTIETYSRELMQVLINILKNAKEALVENNIKDKKIIISIDNRSDTIDIKIKDNGGGIPKDIIDKIFDPYFTTKDEQNGTGLGLYMSKTIIEKHLNGTIKAYNEDDGACFEIELPYKIKS